MPRSAVLNGTVSPDGLTTTYYFEYGTTTAYGLATASRTTDADASVSETVGGLSADTTYHYRLVATNSSGTSYGPDRSFQTASTDPASASGGGGGGGGRVLPHHRGRWNGPGNSGRAGRRHRCLQPPCSRSSAGAGRGPHRFSPGDRPALQSVEKQRLRP